MPSNRTLAIGIGGLALLLMGIGIGYVAQSNTASTTTTNNVSPQTQQPTTEPTEEISPTERPTTATPKPTTTPQREANIRVTAPAANATVGSRFTVTGQARVFENTFQIRVTNTTTNKVVFTKTADTDAKDVGLFGNFSVPVTLATTAAKSGDKLLVEVFQYSAKDGTEIDKVTRTLNYH